MVILITGSSGFVGEVLISNLRKEGFETIGIDIKAGKYTDLIQNISNLFHINKKVDVIIHLAARLEHDRCSKEEYFLTNVTGTKNLLEIAKQNNAYFIYISTTAVYGSPDSQITEKTQAAPNGDYAFTKLKGEEICQEYQKDGLDVSIIRSGIILGEKRLGIYNFIFKNLYNNSIIPILGNGKNKISFVNVNDIAEFLIHLVKNKKSGLIVNFGGLIPGNLNEIIQDLKDYTNSNAKLIHLPVQLIVFLKLLAKLKLIPVTPWHLSIMCKDNYYDNRVLLSTGYSYKYEPIDALKAMADYYKAHH